MEQRMVDRQINKFALRQDPFYLPMETLPLHRPPKVVCHQHAAVEQILAQDRHFLVLQQEADREP